MNGRVILETVGYIGSFLIVVSMLMSSVVRLRVINTIGCIVSGTYALIIRSYPLALMNFCLVAINVYHLLRLNNKNKHYDLIEGSCDDAYTKYLLSFYREDIAQFFPSFHPEKLSRSKDKVFIVCCDQEAAGIMIGKQTGDKTEILLDYSTPVYRDCSVGSYLYGRLPEFGIKELVCSNTCQKHVSYMEKMGFTKNDSGDYSRQLR